MSGRYIRDIKRLIERGGGSVTEVIEGGRHSRVCFLNSDGKPAFILIHRGTHANPTRFDQCIRSELRRLGLKESLR